MPTSLTPRERTLKFSLDMSAGELGLRLSAQPSGPFELRDVDLRLPLPEAPFDMERTTRRLRFVRPLLASMTASVRESDVARALRPFGVIVRMRGDGVRVAFSDGEHWLTCRASLFPEEGPTPKTGPSLVLSFYDIRAYGAVRSAWPRLLSDKLALLPRWLARDMGLTHVVVEAVRAPLRGSLPTAGWKLPNAAGTTITALSVEDARIEVRVGGSSEAGAVVPLRPGVGSVRRQALHRAVVDLEMKRSHTDIEEAICVGDDRAALAMLRRRLEGRGGGDPFLTDRLLQVAAAIPGLRDDCAQVAQRRLEADPDDAMALCALLAVAEQANDLSLAARCAQRTIELASEVGEPLELVAGALALARLGAATHHFHVREALTEAARCCPDEPALLSALASAAHSAGHADLAEQLRKRLLYADISSEEASQIALGLAKAAQERNEAQDARFFLDLALSAPIEEPELLSAAADIATAQGDRALTKQLCLRLASPGLSGAHPAEAARAYAGLARISEPGEAMRLLRMAHTLAPSDREVTRALAELSETTGDAASARGLWSRLLTTAGSDEDFADVSCRLAAIEAATPAQAPAARARLRGVLARLPSHSGALDGLVTLASTRADWEDALAAHERAARVDTRPEDRSRLLQTKGLIEEERMGLWFDAIASYEAAVEADTTATQTAVALRRLEDLCARHGMWKKLVGLQERRLARATTPSERREAGLLLATLMRDRLDRPHEAEQLYRRLLEDFPRDVDVLMGLCALLRGRDDATAPESAELLCTLLLRLGALHPNSDMRDTFLLDAADHLSGRLGRHAEALDLLESLASTRAAEVELRRDRIRRTAQIASTRPRPGEDAPGRQAEPDDDPEQVCSRALALADAGDAALACSLLSPMVLSDRPDPTAADLLRALLESTGQLADLRVVDEHLSSHGMGRHAPPPT